MLVTSLTLSIPSGCFGDHLTDVPTGPWTSCELALRRAFEGDECAFDAACEEGDPCRGYLVRLSCDSGRIRVGVESDDCEPMPPRDDVLWESAEEYVAGGGRPGEACTSPIPFGGHIETTRCCSRVVECPYAPAEVTNRYVCFGDCAVPWCDGYQAPGAPLCRSAADCPSGSLGCWVPDIALPGCAERCEAPRHACDTDADCPTDVRRLICASGHDVCCETSRQCVIPCTDAVGGCDNPTERCRSDGRCEPIPCGDGWACPTSARCEPGAPDADLHGCVRRGCTDDRECDCGTCVHGRCFDGPGFCL